MLRLIEAALALGMAFALHLGVFALLPRTGGVQAAGQGGEALVTLAAADASMAARVADWQRAPVVALMPDTPDLPQAETDPRLSPAAARPVEFGAPVHLPPMTPDQPVRTPPPAAPAALPEAPRAPEVEASPTLAAAPLVPSENRSVALLAPIPPDSPPALTEAEPAPQPAAAPRPKPRPEAKAKPAASRPASEGSAGQTAAGVGGGAIAGVGGAAESATRSTAKGKDAQAAWGSAIRARIERKKAYPRDANGAKGTVTLELSVSAAGTLVAMSVAKSSGSAALDAAALRAVKAAGRFPKAPKGMEGSATFMLPMSFKR